MPKSTLILAILVISNATTNLAQVNTAELYGIIKDPSGNTIARATIKVQTLDTGLARTMITPDSGTYAFLGLRPGLYSVSVEAAGFRPVLAKSITLTVGQKAELPFQLEISPVVEAVEILSNTQLLEARRVSVATTIVERLIKSLPSDGRDYIKFTLLDSAATRANQPSIPPVPVIGPNIHGQQGRANMVNLDGVDAMDNTINGVRATIPQDAVQEFELLKSGYGAEYGRSSGAVINIISKRGTDKFQGDAFGLLRSRNISATSPFAGEPNPGDTNVQAGFSLGGPIRRVDTSFFTSFETTQRNSIGFSSIGRDNYGFQEIPNPYGPGSLLLTAEQAKFIRSAPAALAIPYSQVADQASRTALFGNTPGGPTTFALIPTPLPPSFKGITSEAGNYGSGNDSYIYSLRLDHNFSEVHSIFIRLGINAGNEYGRPSNSETQISALNAFSRTTNLSVRDVAISTQFNSSFGPAWLNELRFQFSRRGLGLTANSESVAFEIPGVASIGTEPLAPVSRVEKRWQLNENVSYIHASHTYKAGVDFNYIPATASFPLNQAGLYSFPVTLSVNSPLLSSVLGSQLASELKHAGAPGFTSAQLYGMGLPDFFFQQFGGVTRATASYRNTTLGLFLQDSWKIASNFLLQYGVRYDVETMSKKGAASPLFQQAEDALGVVQFIPKDTNNVAPRLGFSWDPFSSRKTVVRASYGLYYGHPLTALSFLSDVVDGADSPFLVSSQLTGAADLFRGRALTPIGTTLLNPVLGYRPDQQRYDSLSPIFLDADLALANSPILPTTLPVAANLKYTMAQQVTFVGPSSATSMSTFSGSGAGPVTVRLLEVSRVAW